MKSIMDVDIAAEAERAGVARRKAQADSVLLQISDLPQRSMTTLHKKLRWSNERLVQIEIEHGPGTGTDPGLYLEFIRSEKTINDAIRRELRKRYMIYGGAALGGVLVLALLLRGRR